MPITRSGYAKQRRNGSTRAYRKARAQVLAEERTCWICGQPARANDPLTADHVIPWIQGGTDHRSNMRAAHLSCNSRRGDGRGKG